MSKLTVRTMTASDHDEVLCRVERFYTTGAVAHETDRAVLERTFAAAVSDNPRLAGYVLCADGEMIGYAYLTFLYATEAGEYVMIEELYLDETQRGKGCGTQFFSWLRRTYPNTARFRLEVTAENTAAARLYRRVGFVPLDYQQMVLEQNVR